MIGVPEVVSAWTVRIGGADDETNLHRSPLPYSGEVRIHRRLLMKPVGIPISEFKSIRELLSVFIDILDSMSERLRCSLANLTSRTVHQRLVVEFNILHRDISVNNIIMYTSVKKDSKGKVSSGAKLPHNDNKKPPLGNDGSYTHSDPPGNGTATGGNMEGETCEQKLARWDQERCNLIQDGDMRRGLLIDFDYATLLDQSLPVVPGDRTVGPPSPHLHMSLIIFQGTIPFMSSNILSNFKKDVVVHTTNDDIESLIYVLVWICVLYAGPRTVRQDKQTTETALKPWVMVHNPNDAVNLGVLKNGLRYQPDIVTDDFTPFFQCLSPVVEKLFVALGSTTWSATDPIPNYKTIRDILLEGFGTVEEIPNWSPRKDLSGYGLLTSTKKRKLPSFATSRYEAHPSRSVRTWYC